MSELVISKMTETGNIIRSITIPESGTWYVAKDITTILGYSDAGSSQTVKTNCENYVRFCDISSSMPDIELNRIKDLGISQTSLLIQRPDVHRLIVAAKRTKEEAAQFEKWIFEDVLEQVAETGSYSSTDLSIPTFNDKLFDLISAINAANVRIQDQNRENEIRFQESQTRLQEFIRVSEIKHQEFIIESEIKHQEIIRESEIRNHAIQNRFFDMVEKSEANVAKLIERSDLEKYEACCNAIFTMFTSVSLEKYLDILKPLVKIENNIRANFTYQNLIKYLQIKKIFKSFGEPYQEYIDLGYYEVSKNQNTSVVNITKKGVEHIYSILKSGNNLN